MKKALAWLAVGLLTAGLGAQYEVYHAAQPGAVAHAAWAFTPKNFADVVHKASDIVEAQVVSVQAGAPIVVPAKGEPGGIDAIPTQYIQVAVQRVDKGVLKAGQQLTIFRTGGTVDVPTGPAPQTGAQQNGTIHQAPPAAGKAGGPNGPAPVEEVAPSAGSVTTKVFLVDGDPAYTPGERYLLALEAGPNNTLRPVSPEGRYLIDASNHLTAVTDSVVAKSVNGHTVDDARAAALGRLDI